jgi:RAB protein geranylgeranyltransferase component A
VQGFARLAAVHGGTYMLNKPDLEVIYNEDGTFFGVKDAEGATAKAPLVVGDASYFKDKSRVVARVVRAICIMDHPIPDTSDSHSVQIIIPYSQVGRKNDIYVFCSSYRCASRCLLQLTCLVSRQKICFVHSDGLRSWQQVEGPESICLYITRGVW